MPIYGYDCNQCGRQFEKLVRSSDNAPSCPSCESTDLTRQLSLIADPAKGAATLTHRHARAAETAARAPVR